MKKNKLWIIVFLVVLSVAASYVHRYFVGNNKLEFDYPVITDVIPAIAPTGISSRS